MTTTTPKQVALESIAAELNTTEEDVMLATNQLGIAASRSYEKDDRYHFLVTAEEAKMVRDIISAKHRIQRMVTSAPGKIDKAILEHMRATIHKEITMGELIALAYASIEDRMQAAAANHNPTPK